MSKKNLFPKDKTAIVETLTALSAEANEIMRLIDEANGELTPELEERLNVNSSKLIAKVDSYVFIEEQLEATANIWKRRADACKAMADRYIKSEEKLRNRVKEVMHELDKKELTGNFHRYVLSSLKPKLVIHDEALLPPECKMIISETVPDKEKIKALLEDGIEVPGAELVPVESLRTYETKEE